MFYKLIYLAGIKRRNPSLLPYFEFLKETDRWSIDKLRVYQFGKMSGVSHFCQEQFSLLSGAFCQTGLSLKECNRWMI